MAKKQAVPVVPIGLNWGEFTHILNTAANSLSVLNASGDSNPARAMFQKRLDLNGKVFDSGKFKKGDAGQRLYNSNPDAVARALLGEGHLAEQAVTSLGFCQLMTVYLGAKDSMPREYALAEAILSAYAKYNEVASIKEMIKEPTAKSRTASGVEQAEIEGIWS